ncbi:hypothetical protein OIU77_015592 [Salix suchowensis]|uniref:ALOG domain-containing protein n=1 Tax=Salix suchowensis TaxID=1278906 RepID=A0ABQ8ZHR7_9ROSI|nr:hypothetical protein OIU77_015592 [Salix suchowensis]
MSAAVAAAAAAANMSCNSPRISSPSGTPTSYQLQKGLLLPSPSPPSPISLPLLPLSRYESQKRRDWNTFGQYLRNHRPPLALARCSGAHVLEFLRYLDQFGKTKVHGENCPYFWPASPAISLLLPSQASMGQPRCSHRPSPCRL